MAAAPDSLHSGRRMPALDGLRGLAILLVMQVHFWGLAFSIGAPTPDLAVDRWADRVIGVGWSGVDLFFVLSGFLITGILYDTKGSSNSLRTFYARRILRLAPVYYLFLLFVLVVVPFIGPIDAVASVDELRDIQWWMWSYSINIGTSVTSFDAFLPWVHGPFWSLAVEEQFYLVWPLAVLALPRRPLMGFCCIMIAAALAIRILLTGGFVDNVFNSNAAGVLMPARMDTLAVGALIALAARGPELRVLARSAPMVAGVMILFLVAVFIKNDGLAYGMTDVDRLGFTAFAFLFGALLVATLHAAPGSLLFRALTLGPLRTFGKYSYAMYVFHLLTAFVLMRTFLINGWVDIHFGSQIPLNVIFSVVATATTLGLAWVSWQLVEEPLLRLKKRLPYKEGPETPAPRSTLPLPGDTTVGTAS